MATWSVECYICKRQVQRHEYTKHVASHLAANETGPHFQPNLGSTLAPFTHASPAAPGATSQHIVHTKHSTQPDAFQVWYSQRTQNSPKYTTVDGQKSEPDSHEQKFIVDAQLLRGTTRESVVKIVEQFNGFSCSDKKICLDLVRKVPIFPGLVAYIYTHLVVCPPSGWFSGSTNRWSNGISELNHVVNHWARRELDDIEYILMCKTIKDKLVRILGETEAIKPEERRCKCNPALLDRTAVLNHDVLNLAALAALCVTGPQKNRILDQRGMQAFLLIELFHDLLEADVQLDERYRRHFLNVLIMLSREMGICPRGIYLRGGAINELALESAGEGGYGIVYKGWLCSRAVAVKALKRGSMDLLKYNKQLAKEAIVWRHLRHPNCLPLYGVYLISAEGPNATVALVSPWMNQGTLFNYVKENPKVNRTPLVSDVIRGLDYLHSMQPHVAHRDIKPNILITGKGRACLADFGLVSTFDTDDHFRTATSQANMVGTYNYMAPEIFQAKTPEEKRQVNKRACDMYALGCTIYAAYTGMHPFENLRPFVIASHVESNQRPGFPEGRISLDMWSFVENLWEQDPRKRLTAQEALQWMNVKASQEGANENPPPLEEDWQWNAPRECESLWSVHF